MNLLTKYLTLFVATMALSGCLGVKNVNELKSYKDELKNVNANIYLKSFSDHRQGKALILPEGSDVIYAYKPQSLSNGQMLPLLGYYAYHALELEDTQAENSIGIDVSIRDVKTLIRNGSIIAGKYGYYSVEVHARIIVRDMKENTIIKTFPIVVSKNVSRTTTTGRGLAAKEDRYAMLDVMDTASLKLAEEILEETFKALEDYYIFEEDLSANKEKLEAAKVLEKTHTIEIQEAPVEEMMIPSASIKTIVEQEKALLERKEEQRRMFEQKIKDQKYLDFVDENQ